MSEFTAMPKIPRFRREIVITEKIDGTNSSVFIGDDGTFLIGSRNRWITPEADNFGFARWATENRAVLELLGPGHHFGEWWGAGIQRRYGMTEKVFSLFNVGRWTPDRLPACCRVVPTLYQGPMADDSIDACLQSLRDTGSAAAPGFMKPEGIMIYHTASRGLFKITLEGDEHKGQEQAA